MSYGNREIERLARMEWGKPAPDSFTDYNRELDEDALVHYDPSQFHIHGGKFTGAYQVSKNCLTKLNEALHFELRTMVCVSSLSVGNYPDIAFDESSWLEESPNEADEYLLYGSARDPDFWTITAISPDNSECDIALFWPAARDGAIDALLSIKEKKYTFWHSCEVFHRIKSATAPEMILELSGVDEPFRQIEQERREGRLKSYSIY